MSKTLFTAALVAAGTLVAGTLGATAHVSLEVQEAPVGSTYKATFRVPHGCEGKPTNVVRVQIPDGVIAVKPQPKAGWTLEKLRGDYGKTYDYYGTPTSEGVKEVVWSGGNLGDDEYDEFVLRGFLTTDLKPGDTLHFAVVQECPEGLAERWIEVPAAGQSADDLELPAPGVKLLEKTGGH
ncbi:YcnI family copper-binding membrane protein [Methylobrevis albus]|uniref:YcnI family protein n=1 Tax=Methylobrevis albus TaxID=2793297 RepID=A0A931HYD1_9HYPH|nr:YcnI family protein [Methylobrevis albus]MBH0236385.1 YcnI family protein [Methylobrevis albus]